MEILAQPLSLPFIIENLRYRHEVAPNVKVLAARVGTKGWDWQSWGERKYSGGEVVSRAGGGRWYSISVWFFETNTPCEERSIFQNL
jgi:hypothetical protein